MSISFRIDNSLGVVFTKVEGVVNFQDIGDHQQALLQDPDFDPSFDHLLDGTEVLAIELSADEWREVASTRLFGKGSRRAFVVPDRHAIYGMFRMFRMLRDAEPDDIQVFRDIDEARKWLGLPV